MSCKHKFIHLRTESWYNQKRYANSYFLTDYFYCEKCLCENKIEKVACDISIFIDAPGWTIGITKKRKPEWKQ